MPEELKPLPPARVLPPDNPYGGPRQRIVETHQPFRGPATEGVTIEQLKERLSTLDLKATTLLVYEQGENETMTITDRILSILQRALHELVSAKKIETPVILCCPKGATVWATNIGPQSPVFLRIAPGTPAARAAEILADVRKSIPGHEVSILPSEVIDVGTADAAPAAPPVPAPAPKENPS